MGKGKKEICYECGNNEDCKVREGGRREGMLQERSIEESNVVRIR